MNYEIISTICLCAFLHLFILTCCFVFDCDPYPVHFTKDKDFLRDFFVGYVLPALTILSITFGIFFNAKADDEKYAKIKDVLSSGYTLYINGIETDASHITIEDYHLDVITIEDEIKEVHIAGNKASRYGW